MLSTPILCESNLSLYLKALALSDNGALVFNYAVGLAKSNFTFVNNLFMVSDCLNNLLKLSFTKIIEIYLVFSSFFLE